MYEDIIEEIVNTLKRTQKWRSPGIVKKKKRKKNIWLHHPSFSRQLMTKRISGIIKEPEKFLNGS